MGEKMVEEEDVTRGCTSCPESRQLTKDRRCHGNQHGGPDNNAACHTAEQRRGTVCLHMIHHTHTRTNTHASTHTLMQIQMLEIHTHTHTHTHTLGVNY